MALRVLQGWGKLYMVEHMSQVKSWLFSWNFNFFPPFLSWFPSTLFMFGSKNRSLPCSIFAFPLSSSSPSFFLIKHWQWHHNLPDLGLILCLYNSERKTSHFKSFLPIFKVNFSLFDCHHPPNTQGHVRPNQERPPLVLHAHTYFIQMALFHWTMGCHFLSIMFRQSPQNLPR